MSGISLVMGITGILTSFLAIGVIPSAIGLILGLASKNKKGKSTAGIITSAIGLILSVIFIVVFSRLLKNGGGVSGILSRGGAKEAVGVIINEYNTPPEEMGFPEETPYNPHRDDSVLLSNKNFDIIAAAPEIHRINGADGDLYYCEVNTSESLPEFIYSYYDKHFLTADEKHALINTSDNTVSEIECVGEYLRVAVHLYPDVADVSELRADNVFSGDVLQVYRVYIDNTDITVE